MSRVLGLIAVAMALVACGGGSDDPSASPTSDSPTASQPVTSPDVADEQVVNAGSDLSDFVCEADDDGDWNASGVITNSTGQLADYRVTVVVADGPGVALPGKSRTLTDLAPGIDEPFDVKRLAPSGEADPTCHVELLRLP
ncbi:MAG TPA: hypothetical protein VEX15_04955 [Nocardioidaceae bacterium]|nr:hypothetical protein [Nocardioidaceae bacterium]